MFEVILLYLAPYMEILHQPSASPLIIESMEKTARLINSIGSGGITLNLQEAAKSGRHGDLSVEALKIDGESFLGTMGLFAWTKSVGYLYVYNGGENDGNVYSTVTSLHNVPSSTPLLMITTMAGEGAYDMQALRPKALNFTELAQVYRSGQRIPQDEIAHFEGIRTEGYKVIRIAHNGDLGEYFNVQEGQELPRVNELAAEIVKPINRVIQDELRQRGYDLG